MIEKYELWGLESGQPLLSVLDERVTHGLFLNFEESLIRLLGGWAF